MAVNDPLDENIMDDNIVDMIEAAVYKRDSKLLRELLEFKPDLNTEHGGLILWDSLARLNDVNTATMLVQAGAKVNMSRTIEYKCYPSKYRFLHWLAKYVDKEEYLQLAILMMDNGANVKALDEYGSNPLYDAVINGSIAFTKELLERGADVETTNLYDQSAIDAAIIGIYQSKFSLHYPRKNNIDADVMLPLLIKSGDADAETIKRRGLMAFECCVYEFNNLTEPIKVLLDLGIPIDALDDSMECDQFTITENEFNRPRGWYTHQRCMPINSAIKSRRWGLLEFFLNNGADINKHSRCGRLPIAIALYRDDRKIIGYLIERGADIHKCNKVSTQYPIHIACQLQSSHAVELLLNLGADLNVIDATGKTPMANIRANNRCDETYKTLIRHLIFLMSKGVEVNQNDVLTIEKHFKAKYYYKNCLSEVKRMKETVLHNDISVFDLFVKNIKKISILVMNQEFLKSFDKAKVLFSIFTKKLKNDITLAKQIRSMIDVQENILREVVYKEVHKNLPELVLKEIIDYSFVERVKKLQQDFYLKLYKNGSNDL